MNFRKLSELLTSEAGIETQSSSTTVLTIPRGLAIFMKKCTGDMGIPFEWCNYAEDSRINIFVY